MKRMIAAILLLSCMLTFSACGKTEETELRLYLPSGYAAGGTLTSAIADENYYGNRTVADLLDALLPRLGLSDRYRCTQRGGILWVDLNETPGELIGIDRTLVQSCIVLTLIQLDDIEQVGVMEEGKPFVGMEYVLLTENDMLFSGAEEKPREVSVELYFPRLGGRGLGIEVRHLILTEEDDLYAAVTEALLDGPQLGELGTPFPAGTELLGTRLEDGVCYVNFSAALLTGDGADTRQQDLMLYSIVDTLGNLEAVSAVQILVEGEVPLTCGTTDTSRPLEPNLGLLT